MKKILVFGGLCFAGLASTGLANVLPKPLKGVFQNNTKKTFKLCSTYPSGLSGYPKTIGPGQTSYSINVPITIPDKRELEERARKELRSLSSYVARLIVEDLAARR